MTQDRSDVRELISALADGQLRGEDLARALDLLHASEDARAQWHAYHLAGDVLRAQALATPGGRDAAFVTRLRLRLQQEVRGGDAGASLAGHPDGAPIQAPVVDAARLSRPAANEANWPWKLVAGFASLAAVVTLGWQMTTTLEGRTRGAPELAQGEAPVLAASSSEPVMIRDPGLDQLLAAHQQLGGTSALQMPAGFLRNATFERPAR